MWRRLIPVFLNQSTAVILGLIGVKLISKYVEPELNRSFNLFVTLTPIGYLVTHSGLLNHAVRYWQRESSGTYARFLWDQSVARLWHLAPLIAIICAAMAVRDGKMIWLWAMFPLGLVSNFAMILQSIALGMLTADKRLWRAWMVNLLAGLARVGLPVGLGLMAGMSFLTLGFGYALHSAIVIGLVLSLFRSGSGAPAPTSELAGRWKQELRDYGRPFLWLGVGGWILQFADRLVVDHFFDVTQSGLFGYAANIGLMIPLLASGGVMQLAFPRIFRQSDQARTLDDWKRIARQCDGATAAFVGLTLVGLFLFAWIGPWLVGPLIDSSYERSIAMVLPAGLGAAALHINQFYCLLFQGRHNSAALVKAILLISALKTLGSIVAASISWDALIYWLMLSFLLSGLAGVFLIRRAALAMPVDQPQGPGGGQ